MRYRLSSVTMGRFMEVALLLVSLGIVDGSATPTTQTTASTATGVTTLPTPVSTNTRTGGQEYPEGVSYLLVYIRYNWPDSYALAVAAGETGGSCLVDHPQLGYNVSRTVTPYGFTLVDIDPLLWVTGGVENKAFIIHVFGEDMGVHGNCGFGIYSPLPISALGSRYVVSTCQGYQTQAVLVIASHNHKTDVDITLMLDGNVTYDNMTYNDGDTIHVTLDEYQTFTMKSDYDLTGTVINTTNTVAVFSGAMRDDYFTAVTQLLPVRHHGKEYVMHGDTHFMNSTYQLQVISDQSNTEIMLNNGSTFSLGDNRVYRLYLAYNESLYLNATRPVMATLCRNGPNVYGHGIVVVVPVTNFVNSAFVPKTWCINILTKQHVTDIEVFTVDMVHVTLDWVDTPGSDYKAGRKCSTNRYIVRSASRFAVYGVSYDIVNGGYRFPSDPPSTGADAGSTIPMAQTPASTPAGVSTLSTPVSRNSGTGGQDYAEGVSYLLVFINNHWQTPQLLTVVAGETGGSFLIDYPQLTYNDTGTVTPYGYTFSTIDSSLGVRVGVENKAFIIHAFGKDMNVYGHLGNGKINYLPISALGSRYVVSSCLGGMPYMVLVIANHNHKTDVDITLMLEGNVTYDDMTYNDGDTIHVTLDVYQTFTIRSDYDLTGTVINTTNTVAVLSGAMRDIIVMAVTQLLPVRHHGTEYVMYTADYSEYGNSRYQLQVISDQSNTEIMLNNGSTFSLSDNRVYRQCLAVNESLYLNATRPVMATLCRNGPNTFPPGMVVVVPVSYFVKNALMYFTRCLNILTKQHVTDIEVFTGDMAPVTLDWVDIPGSDYKAGTKCSYNRYIVRSASRFAAYGRHWEDMSNGGYRFPTDPLTTGADAATTTPTPSTCGPMTDASLDEDCSNARCVAVNSSCVTTTAGSRRCACVNKNVQISATECSLGPSVLSSTTNYIFSTNLSRTSRTVGSIRFDGLSTFPTNTFSIEGEVYPDEGILDLMRNSSNIDVALVKEISSAKTFVVALRATSGEFTVQQVVTVRIKSSSFTPEDATVMLVEGTRKGTLIADVRTISSLGGYSNFEMETTDQTARALFNVTTSGQILCGQDMFLSDFTNNDTVAKEYIFSVKATKGGQRATIASFYILLFKSTFTTTLRENWKGNILSYTTTSSKFQVAINGMLPGRLKLSNDSMTISLVEEIDYDAGITSIHFKLDLVAKTSTKSTTVDVHINIEDQNDERPKFKKAVYEFSLLAGSKGNSVVGVVDVIDGDTVGQTTFSLEGRNKDDFSINDDGVLTSKVDLTRGRFPSAIPLRVKAYDGVSYSEEANITVYLISYTINAVNLNKTFRGRVSENSTGAFVANVSVSNYTSYKFANPQADRFFSLNPTSGLVTTTIGLDRENDDQAYTAFTIQAYMDSGDQCSPVTIGQLITNITDVNDNAPEFSSPSYTGRVKENSIQETLVVGLVDIAVTDEDNGVNGSVNFALTGTGKTYFAVEKLNHNQFTIKTSGTKIDREVTPYVVLTLTGTDNPSNPNTGTTALNITIMDVNDNAPQFNVGSTVFWVEENVGPKTITTLTATDMDEGFNAKVSYSLKDGGFGFFQVGESTGEVSTIKAIDRENRKVFNLIIEAKDQGSPSQESVLTITVNIRDVNDEKPTFTKTYYKGSYTENSRCDRSILTVTATDQDEGSNAHITFSTTSSNFTVNNTTGAIRCVIPLDYEDMQQHLIEIKAENPGFPAMSDTVTVEINVEDENDNSPRFDKSNYQSEITTWEWATSNPVDVFEVTDEDSGMNGQFILSMSGETDKFYIDGDTVGVLRIKENASQPVASTTYNFNVTATDKGSPSLSFTVPVSVDVKKIQGNSTVRFSSKDFRFSIEENRLNTTSFGRANAAHDASVSVRYTLIHGGDFRIDPSSGALTCSKAQDRETAANHTMVVRARDSATNASDVAVITVQILDVNDNGPIFLASSGQLIFQVEENSPSKVIGRIIAKDGDADENGRITYSIESQKPRTHFSINPENGTVTVSGILDREAFDTYNLIIKATDNGDAPRTATTSATILVLDVNDNPPKFQTTYAVTVKEDSVISASVKTVSATDGDFAQHGAIVYSSNTVMVNGTVCPFNVSVETGVVKVSGDLDYETTSTYECIVTAVDMKGCSNCTGRLTGSTTMSVTILDFNDNPPVFQGAPYRANISRDANINTLVTDVITATDRDSVNDGNGVVTYHILSNINYFRINRTSGKIYVATTLDKVNDDEVTLRIKATDLPQKDPAMEAITNITISILTDEPRPFFNKTYTFMLTENEEPDVDKSVSIRAYVRRSSEVECNCTYDIIGSDNSSFYIDSMTGDLRQKDPIDREKTGSRFYLKVKAKDRGSRLHRTTDVEVNVKDVNDNLPYFNNTQQNFIVYQSAPAGHVIGRVMSVDADELSHPIYTAFTDVGGIKLLGDGTLVVRASLSNYTEVDMIVSVKEGNFTGPFDESAVTTTKASIEVRPDDYNEHAPVFEKDVYEASLEFLSEIGTEVKITNFRATDDDGHNVTYAIQTRNDRENLKIDGQTGKISVRIKFDDTVPEVIKLVIIATDKNPYPKTGSCKVTITLQGYTQTKCVAENAYSQLQQQRELFLGLFIAMAALLAVISIAAVFAIYKWRTVRRRTQYQENINTAHGKTTKSLEQGGYDSLAAGSNDEETAYNKLKDRDFSSGVPNPAYVSTGPRPTCTPPTDPLPDYVHEDANRM